MSIKMRKIILRGFSKKFKGSEENPGVTRGQEGTLAENGFTIIMDKSKTDNLFTAGSEKSALEMVMGYRGQIDFDQYPQYAKNATLKQEDGQYVFTSDMMSGINTETGRAEYKTIMPITWNINQDLNVIAQQIDEVIKTNIRVNAMAEQEYLNQK